MCLKKNIRLIKCVVFLLILALLVHSINTVLQPKYNYSNTPWPSTTTFNQFYQMKRNSIDVLFLGSSVCINNFSPMQLYRDYHIRSYNLGSQQQSLFASYYWLKEALRFHSPKAVVLDTKFCVAFYDNTPFNTTEGLMRKTLDPMRISPVKIEAVRELCTIDKSQSALSFFLKNIRYHGRWTSLSKSDFDQKNDQYSKLMGYAPGNSTATSFETFTPSDPDAVASNMHGLAMEYLEKIADLCNEKGIQLILVNLAGNLTNDGIHNEFVRFAQDKNADYYNFCETELYNQVGAVLPEESIINHANFKGAAKMTDFMGRLLTSQYGIEGVEDPQWGDLLDVYSSGAAEELLLSSQDMVSYIQNLPHQCTVFIAAKDEASYALPPAVNEALQQKGLRTDWSESMFRQGYVAVLSPAGIYEESGGRIIHRGMLHDCAKPFTVISAGYHNSPEASIMINGTEYSLNRRGLNIVVYSHLYEKVVDVVNFDTHTGAELYRAQ